MFLVVTMKLKQLYDYETHTNLYCSHIFFYQNVLFSKKCSEMLIKAFKSFRVNLAPKEDLCALILLSTESLERSVQENNSLLLFDAHAGDIIGDKRTTL